MRPATTGLTLHAQAAGQMGGRRVSADDQVEVSGYQKPTRGGPVKPVGIYVARFRNLKGQPPYKKFIRGFGYEGESFSKGGYIERAEPVLFIGECGTGKTHLLTGLCVAACRQKRRVRFTTAAGLVNELVEAKHKLELRRVMARWSRYDLIAIDEVGYVPLAEVGAEFLFQVVAERAERAAVVLTTNLPFSEWTQVIPNARLCKALLDRITDRAHILETGTESYRFRRTAEKLKKGAKTH